MQKESAAAGSQPSLFSRGLIMVCIFTGAYMLAAAIAAIAAGNSEFVLYIAVMLVLIALVAFVHWRLRFPTLLLWALSIWGLIHMAGGLVPVPQSWPISGHIRVLYSWWIIPERLKFDHIVHAYGYGVTTWLCWFAVGRAMAKRGIDLRPTAGLVALCVAASMGLGALNEVVEFIATLTMPDTNVGGYENTGWDLISNLAGAVIAGALILAFAPRRIAAAPL